MAWRECDGCGAAGVVYRSSYGVWCGACVTVTTRHETTAASTTERAECGRCGRRAAGAERVNAFQALNLAECDRPGPVELVAVGS